MITSSESDAAQDDLLAQVGEGVVDELRLRRHDLDRDIGELLAQLVHGGFDVASVTATVLAPASL